MMVARGISGIKGTKRSLVAQWRYWGILFAFLQSIFYSLDILLAKVLQNYGFFAQNSAFYRYTSTPLYSLALFSILECRERGRARRVQEPDCEKKDKNLQESVNKESLLSPIWPLNTPEKRWTALGVIAQGALGPLSTICQHYAVEYIPVGDAVVISSSTPILVGILGHFFLKDEKLGIWQFLSSIWAVVGVVVISKPTFLTGAKEFDRRALIGCAFSTATLCFMALYLVVVKSTHAVHYTIKVFVLGCFGLLTSFALSQVTEGFATPVGLVDSLLLLGLSGAALANQIFFTLSLKFETAALVSLINTSKIVFAFLAQFIFLQVTPDKYSAVGGTIIFFSIFVMSFRKYLLDADDNHKLKKMFSILLY